MQVISNCNCKDNNDNINYGLFDFTKSIKQQHNEFGSIKDMYYNKYNSKYDTIIMLNTIHNAFKDKESLFNFKLNIENFSKKNSFLVVRYLDRNNLNKLFVDTNLITHGNGSYIRKINQSQIKIYFTWCHNKSMIETVIDKSTLLNCFQDKWKIIYEENNEKNI